MTLKKIKGITHRLRRQSEIIGYKLLGNLDLDHLKQKLGPYWASTEDKCHLWLSTRFVMLRVSFPRSTWLTQTWHGSRGGSRGSRSQWRMTSFCTQASWRVNLSGLACNVLEKYLTRDKGRSSGYRSENYLDCPWGHGPEWVKKMCLWWWCLYMQTRRDIIERRVPGDLALVPEPWAPCLILQGSWTLSVGLHMSVILAMWF